MRNRLIGAAATALTAAFVLSAAAGMVPAQAQTGKYLSRHSAAGTSVTQAAAGPDFTCPSPAVCVFQNGNFTGNVAIFPTQSDSGVWINLTNPFGQGGILTLPWGSFNDNSGSSVAFGDAQTGQTKCYPAHSRVAYPSVTAYRYMWIEYGVTNCTGHLGPLP